MSFTPRALIRSVAAAGGSSGVPAPTLSGSPTIAGSWDFANVASLHLTGSVINSIDGVDGTSVSMTGVASPVSGLDGSILSAQLNGTSQYLTAASDLGLTATGSTGTIVAVSNFLSTASSSIFCVGPSSGSSGVNQFMAALVTQFQTRANDATTLSTGVGPTGSTGRHLLVSRYDSGVRKAVFNLDGEGTAHLGAANTGAAAVFTRSLIGARASGSSVDVFANANILRVIVYPSYLSDAQVEAIAVWSASNYGTANNA